MGVADKLNEYESKFLKSMLKENIAGFKLQSKKITEGLNIQKVGVKTWHEIYKILNNTINTTDELVSVCEKYDVSPVEDNSGVDYHMSLENLTDYFTKDQIELNRFLSTNNFINEGLCVPKKMEPLGDVYELSDFENLFITLGQTVDEQIYNGYIAFDGELFNIDVRNIKNLEHLVESGDYDEETIKDTDEYKAIENLLGIGSSINENKKHKKMIKESELNNQEPNQTTTKYYQNGVEINFEDINPNQYWTKVEYDINGNEIYGEDSEGYWEKQEFDNNGEVIYRETSSGRIYDNRYSINENKKHKKMKKNESISKTIMNLLETGKPGITMYDKIHSESGTSNTGGVKRSMDNAKRLNQVADKTENEKLSGIGKGEPKYGNFDKNKKEYDDDYIGMLRGMGLQDIQYDTEPGEDYKTRSEEAIMGSSRMGNNPDWANAQRDFDGTKGELGKKIIDTANKKKTAFDKTGKEDHTAIRFKYPNKTHEKTHIASNNGSVEKPKKNTTNEEKTFQNLKTKRIIHFEDDIDKLIPESHKVDGAKFKLFTGNKTVYDLKWDGNALVVESEKNKTLMESERGLFKKMTGYSVGEYKIKPKGYLTEEK